MRPHVNVHSADNADGSTLTLPMTLTYGLPVWMRTCDICSLMNKLDLDPALLDISTLNSLTSTVKFCVFKTRSVTRADGYLVMLPTIIHFRLPEARYFQVVFFPGFLFERIVVDCEIEVESSFSVGYQFLPAAGSGHDSVTRVPGWPKGGLFLEGNKFIVGFWKLLNMWGSVFCSISWQFGWNFFIC